MKCFIRLSSPPRVLHTCRMILLILFTLMTSDEEYEL